MEYKILFGGIEDSFDIWLEDKSYTTIFVLTDTNTNQLCLPYLLRLCQLPSAQVLTISAGEMHKNIATCTTVWEALQINHADRKSLLILLGGGVVGDLGGFCAATYVRGIDFVHIPTTLLSMTDSSVGGKTGVDLNHYKNIVGSFAQPQAVFIDTHFLTSLPLEEWKSGFAEVVKHGIIGDYALFDELVNLEDIPSAPWERLLRASVQVKINIVKQDPYEVGLRKLLNFGHTIGHAVETFLLSKGNPRSHGACVALGMLLEYRLAFSISESASGLQLDDDLSAFHLRRLHFLLQNFRRYYEMPIFHGEDIDAIWELMKHDKKNKRGEVVCVVPSDEPYSMRQIFPNKADFFRLFQNSNV